MSQPKRVLFIDDDEPFLNLLERAASKVSSIDGIAKASDGQEAADYIRGKLKIPLELPHLVFVDINMPRMDGFAFLQWLSEMKKEHPLLSGLRPITMLTSSDEERDKIRAKALGADDYIVKPYSLKALRDLLTEVTK